MRKVLAAVLIGALLATGCASNPVQHQRASIEQPAVIALPRGPQVVRIELPAHMGGGEGVAMTADEAARLLHRLNASVLLHEQAGAFRAAAIALDGEVDACFASLNGAEAELAAARRSHLMSTWSWRLGAIAVGLLALGGAAN